MTKSTEEMSKELHDWLKRDGECFHDFQREPQKCKKGTILGYYDKCSQCGIYKEYGIYNPNFFSPATEDQAAVNFFWLWNRAKEKDWWRLFMARIIYPKVEGWNKNIEAQDYDGAIPEDFISCTELAKALYSFKGKHEND